MTFNFTVIVPLGGVTMQGCRLARIRDMFRHIVTKSRRIALSEQMHNDTCTSQKALNKP